MKEQDLNGFLNGVKSLISVIYDSVMAGLQILPEWVTGLIILFIAVVALYHWAKS